MSKIKVDMADVISTNDLYSGNTPVSNLVVEPANETIKAVDNKPKGRPANQVDTKDTKKVNGKNKKDNYTITLKIDADITEYLKNIEWINYNKGNRNQLNKNAYINNLIRQDMIKTLGLKANATDSDIVSAWDTYKKANNLD